MEEITTVEEGTRVTVAATIGTDHEEGISGAPTPEQALGTIQETTEAMIVETKTDTAQETETGDHPCLIPEIENPTRGTTEMTAEEQGQETTTQEAPGVTPEVIQEATPVTVVVPTTTTDVLVCRSWERLI